MQSHRYDCGVSLICRVANFLWIYVVSFIALCFLFLFPLHFSSVLLSFIHSLDHCFEKMLLLIFFRFMSCDSLLFVFSFRFPYVFSGSPFIHSQPRPLLRISTKCRHASDVFVCTFLQSIPILQVVDALIGKFRDVVMVVFTTTIDASSCYFLPKLL